MNKGRVLVAGGTGSAGQAYAGALVREGYEVAATARNERGAGELSRLGAEPFAIDLTDPIATREAVGTVDAVFIALLGRGQDAADNEDLITRNVIDAAVAGDTSHIVYTSVHKADQATAVPHFEVKGRLERYLAASGVPWTVLRPCTFMDALASPWFTEGLRTRGVLSSPIGLDTRISYIATADLAEVAVRALSEPRLAGATIELGGPSAVTYRQLIPMLSSMFEREISFEQMPVEQVESQLGSDMAAMIRLFNESGFVAEPDPLVAQLGIRLTPVHEFLRPSASPSPDGGHPVAPVAGSES